MIDGLWLEYCLHSEEFTLTMARDDCYRLLRSQGVDSMACSRIDGAQRNMTAKIASFGRTRMDVFLGNTARFRYPDARRRAAGYPVAGARRPRRFLATLTGLIMSTFYVGFLLGSLA